MIGLIFSREPVDFEPELSPSGKRTNTKHRAVSHFFGLPQSLMPIASNARRSGDVALCYQLDLIEVDMAVQLPNPLGWECSVANHPSLKSG